MTMTVVSTDTASRVLPRPAKPSHHPRSAIIDRPALQARLDEIGGRLGADRNAMRAAALEEFRTAMADGQAIVRAWFEVDGQGLKCVSHLGWLEDEVIRAIHHFVTSWMYPADNPSTAERIAIVAVGGYGRGTLAPGSDIDLLFLLPYKQTAWSESVIEAVLYLLWDLRQKVGHSTRTVNECLRQAMGDMTIRTALHEARFILGDASLFADFQKRFDKEIVSKTAREFVAAKLAERDSRLAKSGASRYVVEPNVKEGKGGLRDLNTLFWIAKYVYRVSEVSDLIQAGVFTQREARLFRRCEEFLWRVRCHLHYVAGRPEERLTFDYQRTIAQRLGYATHNGLSDVERFMKHYFLIAKDVGDLTAIVCAALEEKQAKPRAALNRFMGKLRRRSQPLEFGDFSIEFDRITVANFHVFETDPVNLIRLYWLADRHRLAIHPDAMRLVTLSLKRIDASVRENAEANRLFIEILTSRNAPETVLRLMNEAGVLGRFIPEFGRIVAMMQFNMYHHFTVDEHLIRCIGILSRIESGELVEDHPVASEILPTIFNRKVLYIALFIHDIAKGRPEDHSIAGAAVARKICPRFGLTGGEVDTVAWLIEHHLDMSNVAQGRDLSDRGTIEAFANTVQTLERLRMLLVLTVCDIRGVGPGVWNGWKGQLLRTLYWETEPVLSGGHSAIDRKQRVVIAQEELRRALVWSDPDFEAYAARHYQAYWLKVDLKHKIRHANLLRLCEVELRSLATEYQTESFTGVTELTVVAPDHPRLLSIIAGACVIAGANIVDAQIFTTTDGLAVDTISIRRAFDLDADEERRAARVTATIEKALRGEIRLGQIVAEKSQGPKSREKAFHVEPEVIIDNNLSNQFTVLEVAGLDRPGLLYDLTAALSRLNLNIGSAHIVTFGEKAVDAFYVTDLTGLKVTNTSRQAAIRRQLTEILQIQEPAARSSGRKATQEPAGA
ncbi:[protein-PII] uridylyltransferase [Roseiarcaceae bacterium H3SJ34-1]|nr:[protein-PII] uridylyltransferase [Roseiarcaceae bacterium H3SJ34-1]